MVVVFLQHSPPTEHNLIKDLANNINTKVNERKREEIERISKKRNVRKGINAIPIPWEEFLETGIR